MNENRVTQNADLATTAPAGLLPATLRMMAAEIPTRRVRREIETLADRVEAGQPLDDALASARHLPSDLARLLQTAGNGGIAIPLIDDWSRRQSERRDLRQSLFTSLLYPALLVSMVLAIGTAFSFVLIPSISSLHDSYDTQPPAVVGVSVVQYGIPVMDAILISVIGLWCMARLFPRSCILRWLLYRIPFIGTAYRCESISGFTGRLALLLRASVPADEAIELAGAVSGDPLIKRKSRRACEAIRSGVALPDALRRVGFAEDFAAWTRWGEDSGMPIEAFETIDGLYADRSQSAVELIGLATVPLSVCFAALVAFIMIFTLFVPMLTMIQQLT